MDPDSNGPEEEKQHPIEESDSLLDVTRWHKERADPDYDEESVTHLVEDDSTAEFLEWLPGPPGSDAHLAKFRVEDVEYDGEAVDYSIEISASLLKEAADAHPDI